MRGVNNFFKVNAGVSDYKTLKGRLNSYDFISRNVSKEFCVYLVTTRKGNLSTGSDCPESEIPVSLIS